MENAEEGEREEGRKERRKKGNREEGERKNSPLQSFENFLMHQAEVF